MSGKAVSRLSAALPGTRRAVRNDENPRTKPLNVHKADSSARQVSERSCQLAEQLRQIEKLRHLGLAQTQHVLRPLPDFESGFCHGRKNSHREPAAAV